MDRRKFVSLTGLAGAAGLLAACQKPGDGAACETAGAQGKAIKWKMVTAWPKDFPGLGTGANRLANYINRLTNGRLQVQVYGGNELVPPFEVFDAVSRGTAQMGHSTSYYWKGKIKAASFFCTTPFGLTAQEINGWLYHGGGMELWRELYAPFDIIPFAAGNSGVQFGGWFNREIHSMDDIQGLKMRIPGLGGDILQLAGGTPVTIAGAEIFTALQTGTIDAAEWVGPYNDLAFGLFRAAKYYYYPGWWETGSVIEAMVNKPAYEALPADLQAAVEVACQAANMDMLSEFMAHNATSLRTLKEEHGVQIRTFPPAVLKTFEKLTTQLLQQLAQEDAQFARIYAAYLDYYEAVRPLSAVSEQVILNLRDPA